MQSSDIFPHGNTFSFDAPKDIEIPDSEDAPEGPACLICMDEVTSPVTTDCGCNTEYHSECLKKWLMTNTSCPTCRKRTRISSDIGTETKDRIEPTSYTGFTMYPSGTGFREPTPSFSILGRPDSSISFTIGITSTPTPPSTLGYTISEPGHRARFPVTSRKKTKKCHYCSSKFSSMRGICNHLMRQHTEEFEASNYGRYIYAKTPEGPRRQFYGFECTSRVTGGRKCGHVEIRGDRTLEECELSMHLHWCAEHCSSEDNVPVDYIL